MITHPGRRRAAATLSSVVATFSAVMLVISVYTVVSASSSPAGAATAGSVASITAPGSTSPLAGGGTETAFVIRLPENAACTGDTSAAGYRVQSYIVAGSTDPNSLQFNGKGPTPAGTGANLSRPLFSDTSTSPFVNGATDVAATTGGPGLISGLPAFSFRAFNPNTATIIPPGTYNLGIACTLGDPGPTQLDKYWNVQFTFTADAGDPGGVKWEVSGGSVGTTTTTTGGSTTTTDGGSTTTTDGGSTTTTDGGSTTTTDGSTTTTGGSGVGDGGVSGGTPSAASAVTTAGQLPYTGSSPLPMVFWAACLIVFGRTAMLLGKRTKVVGGDRP